MEGIGMRKSDRFDWGHGRYGAVLAVLLALVIVTAGPMAAHGFQLHEGPVFRATLDSTLSWGMQYRVQERNYNIIGIRNGGQAYSVNYDDGNLNYRRGVVSNAAKLTSELDLRSDNVGVFVRGTAFYDWENMHGKRERTKLTEEAEDAVGRGADLLDAYAWGSYDLGNIPV